MVTSLRQASLDEAHWPETSTLIDAACGTMGNGLAVAEQGGEIANVPFAGFYSRGQRRDDYAVTLREPNRLDKNGSRGYNEHPDSGAGWHPARGVFRVQEERRYDRPLSFGDRCSGGVV